MLEDPYEYLPQPKTRFWGWTVILWTAAILFFCFGLAYCSRAGAETVSASAANGDKITLYDEPCSLQHEWFKGWRKAAFFYEGKLYEACWRRQADGVLIIDAAGDVSAVSLRAFRRDQGV